MGLTFNLGRVSPSVFTDSSLNVGIGAAPSGTYKLEVTGTAKVSSTLLLGGALSGTSATFSGVLTFANGVTNNIGSDKFFLGSGGYNYLYCRSTGLQILNQADTAALVTILNGGNVGIGTSPNRKFSVNGDINATDSTNNWDMVLRATSTESQIRSTYSGAGGFNPMTFYTSDTERMRITSGGFLKVSNNGTYYSSTDNYFEFKSNVSDNTMIMWNSSATPSGLFINYTSSPNNTASQFLRCFDGNVATERASIRSNGGFANYSGNNVNLASDRRLKKDIIPLLSEWNKLKQIEVVNFKYKDSTDETALYGAIAQQVQEIYPNLVIVTREATETEPEYYGLREQPFQWLTTKVLQEAMAKIEELQSRLDKAGL